jgi:hypothetical protein
MAEAEVAQFLTHLARDANVAASTQNQALSALLFLYKEVLKHEIGWLEQVERAKKPQKMPVVLSRDEIKQIFAHLKGVPKNHGRSSLRKWATPDGVRSSASQGFRFRLRTNHGARCKRRPRPNHDASTQSGRDASTTFGQREGAA